MKGCELCERPARMYCESDQASLCWDCDARVHGANFLVARHSRSLLCRQCQAPTPWKAEGARLGPTVSFCERCAGRKTMVVGAGDADDDDEEEDVVEEEDDDEEEEDEDDCDESNEEEEAEEEEEEAENQVVPWKLAPPPATSSSSSEESSSSSSHRNCNGFLKRSRENADLDCSQDNETSTSCQPGYLVMAPSTQFTAQATAEDEATSFCNPFHPFKVCRRSGDHTGSTTGPSASIHFRNQRDQWAINSVSSAPHSPPI